jgi:hypothetical protein
MSDPGPEAPTRPRLRWLREPLLHFVVLGAALLAGERLLAGARPPPPAVIAVDAQLKRQLVQRLSQRQGRPPTEVELGQAIDDWVESEILFREALRLGLHQGDPLVRERLVEKMRFVLAQSGPVTEASEEGLRRWFQDNRRRYERPVRLDFAQVLVEGTGEGERREAERLLAALRAGTAPESQGTRYREFQGRTLANVEAMYGSELATALKAQPPRRWQLQASARGFHLLRLDGLRDGGEPSFEAAREQVQQDWHSQQRRQQASQALGTLRRSYQVQGGGT